MTTLGEQTPTPQPPPLPGRYLLRDPSGAWSAVKPIDGQELLGLMATEPPSEGLEGWAVLHVEPAAEPFPA
jgi:hypothetical protein